ncbi:hypothetical protein GGR50DRAFT_188761 [Xylaria sp. CBS 124048]|nr:hypothetical protein GGR50DRAFT_188761 [Xylaria sp. CBS 124048]
MALLAFFSHRTLPRSSSFTYLLLPPRQYPGPLATKLLGAYGGFFALKGTLHLETYKNHIKYGKSEHRPKRRLISQFLSDQSMRGFAPIMNDLVEVFLRQLMASDTEPVTMAFGIVPCHCLYAIHDTRHWRN